MTTKKTSQQSYVAVTFGWGQTFAVPTEGVSTLLSMLEGCIRVESDSYKDESGDYRHYWYKSPRATPPSLEIIRGEILNEKLPDEEKKQEAA